MKAVLERAESLRLDLTAAIDRDASAFEAVIGAYKLPKDTPEQQDVRSHEVERATFGAAQVPLEVAGMAVEVMELAVQAVSSGNLNAISDGATGAALARAALTGAGYNVRINITGLQDQGAAQGLLVKLRELEGRAASLEERIRQELVHRGGMAEG
jgi:formiminotetrahydrofolate cyclodeaminase